MIDALGFRGIWGNNPGKPSLEAFVTLKAVRAALEKTVQEFGEAIAPRGFSKDYKAIVKKPIVEFRFLSDTIIVAASVRPRQRAPRRTHLEEWAKSGISLSDRQNAVDALMRYIVCHCVCAAVQAAAIATTPLAYRGAVSVGFFALEDNFILGPAVDEAASLMNLADAAMVLLSPSASRLKQVLRFDRGVAWDDMSIVEDVPMRDGRSLRGTVINPFALASADEAKAMRRQLLASMNSAKVDVTVKRQNTWQFFKAIDDRTKRREMQKRIMLRRAAQGAAVPKARA